MKVLITGAGGTVGRQLVRALESKHELLLAGRSPRDDGRRWIQMDVTQPSQVQKAMAGVDAVIHLAIATGYEGDYEDDEFNQIRFDVNVRGTLNVLEAARNAGVSRVVQTSSLMVVWGYPPPQQVASDAPARPVGTYALSKQLGEVMCEHYAREHGLSIVCLRIPKPVDVEDESWKQRPLRPQWIAFPDLCRAYELSLTAKDIAFEIVTIVGESSQRRWDLSKAETVLGYRPGHCLENEGYDVGDETAPLVV